MTRHTAKPEPTNDSAAHGELFPIRTVASLTGVNAITLRAWERRYGLVEPVRTATGHRLYRREDIELIHQALGLMNKGVSIGQVKKSLHRPARLEQSGTHSKWQQFQSRMLEAITKFDEDGVEHAYNAALALYPVEQVTLELLLPLLQELGRRWETTEGSIAEEHFFGVYLRNKLGARFHHRQRGESGPRILTACLPGEQHEIGLLIFALTAHDHGLHPVLLGANTPLGELPTAVKRARCAAIVLSGSITPAREVINIELRELVTAVRVPVFVGGMASVRSRDSIVAAGAIPLGIELSLGAERIRSALTSVKPNT
jgi:MerR family transcriptional regulator, light-induced transcriptional regulator